MRQIIFRDGVLYDRGWNAIDPTEEELQTMSETLRKYQFIKKASL